MLEPPESDTSETQSACSLADAYLITPLFLRQNVSVLTAVPAKAASAYTAAHAVTVFTQVQPDVFVHESTHAQVRSCVLCGLQVQPLLYALTCVLLRTVASHKAPRPT